MLFAGIALIGMGIQAFSVSPVSLYAAGGAGLLLIICMVISLKNPRWGYIPALVICLALIGRFAGSMATKGFKLYPDAVTIGIAVVVAASLLAGHFMAQKAKKLETANNSETS